MFLDKIRSELGRCLARHWSIVLFEAKSPAQILGFPPFHSRLETCRQWQQHNYDNFLGPAKGEATVINTRAPLAVSVLLVFVGACAPHGTSNASSVKIYGGQEVTANRWSNVVAILINQDGGTSLCSGTLVTPRLVITAAHCMADAPKDPPLAQLPPKKITFDVSPASAMQVVVGNDARKGTTHAVQKAAFNPAYQDEPVHDIAYLVLSEDVTDVDIIPPSTDTAEAAQLATPGTAATIVGFGTTETDVIGTKYEATTTVGASQDGALFIGGGGKDTCQGDSGGPAFGQLATGEWRVFGVTSRGAGCGDGGLYSRVIDGLCWVEQDSGISLPNSKLPCDADKAASRASDDVQQADASGVPAATADAAVNSGDGATVPSVTGGIGNDIHLILGAKAASLPDGYNIVVAAPKVVARVTICVGSHDTCAASQHVDLGTQPTTGDDASLNYFGGAGPISLTTDTVITLLGYDASGVLVQVRDVGFAKKS